MVFLKIQMNMDLLTEDLEEKGQQRKLLAGRTAGYRGADSPNGDAGKYQGR
jgi:hypothetical protein